ncbi:Rieske (2Fe-2S) protein [Lysobacter brunescens]|uniref:Rieske (2Fe-2S) protein n=1 Tax=Lysobacter brunescens TaxID=262323 RepID=A0ABW2YC16_9GAMM
MRQAAPVVLARLSDLPEGEPVAVEATLDGEAESLILFREGDAVRAWRNICPHAGRPLDWSPGKFLRSKDGLLVCAVHGASFELGQGACVAGPCRGQSLGAVPVAVVDGQVLSA